MSLNFELLDPQPNEVYIHKNGHHYKILNRARNSNDCTQELVVYEALEDSSDYKTGQIWVRSLVEFSTPGRFTKIE